jgi:hypothetical protein
MASASLAETLAAEGFALLPGVLPPGRVAEIASDLAAFLESAPDREAVRTDAATGGVYAARNLAGAWPWSATVWRGSPLTEALTEAVGPAFGLVHALLLAKPPGRGWAVPPHRDTVYPVTGAPPETWRLFRRPTVKAGVPHAEFPEDVLAGMLIARVHLDDAGPGSGPLEVVRGSHREGKVPTAADAAAALTPLPCRAGDVLLMRPLLAHASGKPAAGATGSRRVLQLVFAPSADLPDGLRHPTFLAFRDALRQDPAGRAW